MPGPSPHPLNVARPVEVEHRLRLPLPPSLTGPQSDVTTLDGLIELIGKAHAAGAPGTALVYADRGPFTALTFDWAELPVPPRRRLLERLLHRV